MTHKIEVAQSIELFDTTQIINTLTETMKQLSKQQLIDFVSESVSKFPEIKSKFIKNMGTNHNDKWDLVIEILNNKGFDDKLSIEYYQPSVAEFRVGILF